VLEANDGLQAVGIGEREDLDLVFMDADLPHIDGIAAVGKLRQREQLHNLPIVMTYGWVTADFRAKALAAGCIAYVPKPIEFDEIDQLLFTLIPCQKKFAVNGG
jgi:CheY-like chemotaxis protein